MAFKMNSKTFQPIEKHPDEIPLWADKKRPFFGLPVSFSWYALYPDRLIFKKGFFVLRQDELRAYRIVDVTVRQSFFQCLFNVGTIILVTGDASTPKFRIQDVRQPFDVARLISEVAEFERRRAGIGIIESLHF